MRKRRNRECTILPISFLASNASGQSTANKCAGICSILWSGRTFSCPSVKRLSPPTSRLTSLVEEETKKIYETYKMRWEIEQLFDTMRNTLDADASFMQDAPGFEAWTFINHLTLMMACRVLSMIRAKKLAKDWSLAGVMDHLSKIQAVQIAGEWQLAEVIKKTKKMLDKLSIKLDLDADLIPKH
jgi:hypothetical protein